MLSCSPPSPDTPLSCGRKNYLPPTLSSMRPTPLCARPARAPRGPHVSRRPSNHSSPLLYTSSIPTVCQPHRRLAHLIPRDTTLLLLFSSSPFESHLAHTPLSLSLRSFPVPRACHCSPHKRHHTRVHPFACTDSRSSRNLVRHPSLSRPRPSLPHTLDPFIRGALRAIAHPLDSFCRLAIRVPIPPVSPSASHCSYPRADAHAHAMVSLRLVAPLPFSHPSLCVTPSQFHSKVLV